MPHKHGQCATCPWWMALEVALLLHTQRTSVARGGSAKSRWVWGLPEVCVHSFVPIAGHRSQSRGGGWGVGPCLAPPPLGWPFIVTSFWSHVFQWPCSASNLPTAWGSCRREGCCGRRRWSRLSRPGLRSGPHRGREIGTSQTVGLAAGQECGGVIRDPL